MFLYSFICFYMFLFVFVCILLVDAFSIGNIEAKEEGQC